MPFVLGGLLGGLAVFGIGLYGKKRELERRAAQLQEGFAGQGSGFSILLELQGRQLHDELNTLAQQTAQRAAADTMARVYGITPGVVQALSRLANRLPL